RDVVVRSQTGLLVPPEDSAALADAITTLVADPERRRRMGQAGRQRVLEHFAVETMVAKTAGVYDRAAAAAWLIQRASSVRHRDYDECEMQTATVEDVARLGGAMSSASGVGINASVIGESPTGLGLYAINLVRALDGLRDDLSVYTSCPGS